MKSHSKKRMVDTATLCFPLSVEKPKGITLACVLPTSFSTDTHQQEKKLNKNVLISDDHAEVLSGYLGELLDSDNPMSVFDRIAIGTLYKQVVDILESNEEA
jgi:hypothetical protein